MMLKRHAPVACGLERHFRVTQVTTGAVASAFPTPWLLARAAWAHFSRRRNPDAVGAYLKRSDVFLHRSRQAEAALRQVTPSPDFVLHYFGMYMPFWDATAIPFAIYTDFTMAEAREMWPEWAPFRNDIEYYSWFAMEKRAYDRASHIFTMGSNVRRSLIQNYAIPARKITVVGAPGHLESLYQGEKTFGSQRILFNGSNFRRKGGDLLVAAFERVRMQLPGARLTIIGGDAALAGTLPDWVECTGHIRDRGQMQELFLASDLVVSPARCEPYGIFLVEAMNFGVPCIVSDAGGMPDIVTHGQTGIVMKHPHPEALARQIMDLLLAPETLSRLSAAGREKVRTTLNAEAITDRMAAVIHGILDRTPENTPADEFEYA